MTYDLDSQLRKYLAYIWLRPETVMFQTLKSKSLSDIAFDSPSVDISCGEGSFLFQHLGGEFEFEYDQHMETRAAEFSHDKFIDIIDADTDIKPPIKKMPDQLIDFGTDWKQKLLDKSARIGIYKDLILHDNNIMPLPFDTESLKTVFSNSLYWVPDIEAILADISRILRPDGTIVLHVPTPNFLTTLDRLEPVIGDRAVSILDRQRRATMPTARHHGEWATLLEQAGFKVNRVESVFPHESLIDYWNVGMRPVAHLLYQMANDISPEKRLDIKKQWTDIMFDLLKPIINLPNTCSLDKSPYLLVEASK